VHLHQIHNYLLLSWQRIISQPRALLASKYNNNNNNNKNNDDGNDKEESINPNDLETPQE